MFPPQSSLQHALFIGCKLAVNKLLSKSNDKDISEQCTDGPHMAVVATAM